MSVNEKLKNEIKNIWFILIGAEDCFVYSKYLYVPNSVEERRLVNDFNEIKFIRGVLWSMTVIEITKLFSNSPKSHHFNINSFISKLKDGNEFSDANIDTEKIADWEKRINTQSKLIKDLKDLRDKFYAHSDRDREKYQFIDPRFSEIEGLFSIVKSVIKEIYQVAFDSDVDFSSPTYNTERISLLNLLVKGKQKRDEEIKEEFFKNRIEIKK